MTWPSAVALVIFGLFVLSVIGYVVYSVYYERTQASRMVRDGQQRIVEDNSDALQTSTSMRRIANERRWK